MSGRRVREVIKFIHNSSRRQLESRAETKRKCRIEFICKKWLNMKEELAYRKITTSTRRTYIRNVGKYLDRARGT
jgi:hypothetical protein